METKTSVVDCNNFEWVENEKIDFKFFPFVCVCVCLSVCLCPNEVSAILRSGRNKTKSKKSKKKKDSANDETISGATGAADASAVSV